MPSATAAIGGTATAYVPDDTQQIALGYTHVRFYWGTSEAGSYSLVDSEALVAGQNDYSYNKTDANRTDWFYWALYGATPGEGPASEPMPIGPPTCSRKQIRQGVGRRLRLVDIVTVASAADATSFVASELIDPDASAYRFANRFARPSSGTYAGNTRRVRSYSTTGANNGYAPATGTIIVGRSFGGTLSAGNEIELWKPKGDDDPSVLIDEAMNRSRRKVWWEDSFYLTADASVSEYWLPAAMLPGSIKAVDWASDSYPDRPAWQSVGYWETTQEFNQSKLTLLQGSFTGRATYDANKVVRIVYNRFADRMDSESDYWDVPLEWAIAETCLEYLREHRIPGGGKEDTADATVSIATVAEEVAEFRRAYMPSVAGPHVRLAR